MKKIQFVKSFLTVTFGTFLMLQYSVSAAQSKYTERELRKQGIYFVDGGFGNCNASGSTSTPTPGDDVTDAEASNSIDFSKFTTPEQKIAQTFIVGFSNSDPGKVKSIVDKYKIGGVVIQGHNDDKTFNKAFFDDLSNRAGTALLVAVDQEGGQVQRYDKGILVGSQPSAKAMGAMSTAEVEAIGKKTGDGLIALGVNVDLAPVLDVDNGVNAISTKERSFSKDPNVIIDKAGAFARGLAKGGVKPILKHFPGHGNGSGTDDSDSSIVTTPNLASLKTTDLVPYQQLANLYDSGVMLGNLIVPGLTEDKTPTSLSPATVNLLRANYGFSGFITTDDLTAGSITAQGYDTPTAVSKSLAAGVSAPLFSFTNEGDLQKAIESVKANVTPQRIDDALRSTIAFKNRLNLSPPKVAVPDAPSTTDPTTPTTDSPAVGSSIYIVGDSITARAAGEYTASFKAKGLDVFIDASSGRSVRGSGLDGNKLNGIDAVNQEADKTAIANAAAIVVALGTNSGETEGTMSDLLTAIRASNKGSPIYWVDTIAIGRPDYSATKSSNVSIYANANSKYNIISWARAVDVSSDPAKLSGNETDPNSYILPYAGQSKDAKDASLGVHPTTDGAKALALLVSNTVAAGSAARTSTASGCCSVKGSDTPLLGADNVEQAFNYFIQQGLTPAQSAGIIGNMIHESGVDPTRLQGDFKKDNPSETIVNKFDQPKLGWGIVQWTPISKIIATAHNAGGVEYAEIDTLGFQLEFLWNQLMGTAWRGNPENVASVKRAGDALKASTTVADAARAFGQKYEVFTGSGDPNNAQYGLRINSATDVLARYGGGDANSGAVQNGSINSCAAAGVTNDGSSTDFVNGFVVYRQNDPAWANNPYGVGKNPNGNSRTIASSGCGPSAMAMIITNLTGKRVTPADTSAYGMENHTYGSNGGSDGAVLTPVLAAHWGLKAEHIGADIAKINKTLSDGGLVITSGRGGLPFSAGGHFIVIRALTQDGKWLVGDSSHTSSNPDTNTVGYDPAKLVSEFTAGGYSTFAITK